MTYIESLQDEIRIYHGCESVHVESVPVTEIQGGTVWEGIVEVFALQGHATAKRCYAWSEADGPERTRFVALLEVPSVDSPQGAVRHIVSGRRRFANAASNTFGLLKPEVLAVHGGWRDARMLDGEFMGWLCPHVHATAQDAESCPHKESILGPRRGS